MRSDARRAAVRVAVIDSGVDAAALGRDPFAPAARPARAGHGTEVARLILAAAPDAALLDARVFTDGQAASAEVVAEAIHWAVDQGAGLINLSLGLRDDRWALRHACACAHAAGVLLVASMPARGAAVYPAAYPDVIAVCGDARCRPDEWSQIAPRLFGACPAAPDAGDFAFSRGAADRPVHSGGGNGARAPSDRRGGASYAAARVSGQAARWLGDRPDGAAGDAAHPHDHRVDHLINYLAAGAAYRGRERHLPEHAA